MMALDALGGVRRMRCRIPYQGTPGWNTYVGLARAGVTFCFTLSTRPLATTIQDLRAFARVAPGAIWAIEFPNEPDLNPVTYAGKTDRRLGVRTGDAPALIAFCTEAHRLIRATPELRAVPIIAFNDYMQREQVGLADFGNSHIYPRQNADLNSIITRWRDRVRGAGFREGVITEWGRTTGGGSRNFTVPPVSLEQQGELLAGDVKRWLDEPMLKTISLYELFSWGGSGEMENFGLFDRDMKPRPAASLLRQLLT
ncbi:calcium-binding protein [uncultured Sphingomonas sp.]|uniref:calcium-binding protein n=1 Tax=uncultured Sphingomonas sp. TaxID=158754 RepID=UPI0025EABE3E|nr:calcium-binding protein [uncultured Sphingomonas sp.]